MGMALCSACAGDATHGNETRADAGAMTSVSADGADTPEPVAAANTTGAPDDTPSVSVEPDAAVATPEPTTQAPEPSTVASAPTPSADAGAPSSNPGADPSAAPEPTTTPVPSSEDAGTPPDPAPGEGPDADPAPVYPEPGAYGELAPLLEANSEMAVAEVLGIIYVLGGYPASREVQTTVQAYDPATDSWTLKAPLPTPLHHPVAVGFEGKLYSFGGQVSQAENPDTNRTLVYDPASDSWEDLTPMPTARGAGAAAVVDGVAFVIGGRPPAGNAAEAYDVAGDNWTTLAPLPTTYDERNHLAAVAIGGLVYVAGGRYDGGSFTSPMTDSLDILDPVTGSWSPGAPMPRPRGGVNGVAAHGCFHVFGGEGSGTGEPNDVFPDHDVYDPSSDTWSNLPPLPVPVHGVTGAVFLNGLIYIPGGGTSSGGSSGSTLFQVYHPTTRCD